MSKFSKQQRGSIRHNPNLLNLTSKRDPWEAYECFLEVLIREGWWVDDVGPVFEGAMEEAESFMEPETGGMCSPWTSYEDWVLMRSSKQRNHKPVVPDEKWVLEERKFLQDNPGWW